MPKKSTDSFVKFVGRFHGVVSALDTAVAKRGGSLAESVSQLALSAHADKLEMIADILASVQEQPEPSEVDAATAAALAKRRALFDPWIAFYGKHFPQELAAAGGTKAFDTVAIPPQRPGLDQLEVVLKGLTMNEVYAKLEKQGYPCWRYAGDLDGSIPKNDRMPTESYALWHRGRDEADEELKNLSANDLAAQRITTMGVLEYEIFKLKHFEETGRHLDVVNITLLAGSRFADGRVPYARWSGGGFRVGWARPRSSISSSSLRSREVVSG